MIGRVIWGLASQNAGGSAALTPQYPTSCQRNDLLLLWTYCRASCTYTVPAGWTSITATNGSRGSFNLMYKAAAGTETGTLSVSNNAQTNSTQGAQMLRVPGGEVLGPIFSGTPSLENEGPTTYRSNAGVTTDTPGCIICFFTGKGDGASGSADYSGWSGGTALVNWEGRSAGTTGGNDGAIGVGVARQLLKGPTGTVAVAGALAWTGMSYVIAIKPRPEVRVEVTSG